MRYNPANPTPRIISGRLLGRRRQTLLAHMLAVLGCLLVVHQQLPVLAIPARLDLGLVHHSKDALPAVGHLVEDAVHLLERAVRRLRVEEVDTGHHEGVDDGKDDVRPPPDVVEGDGRDHDDEEVEDPVGRRRQRVGGRPDPQRDDLGRVQPLHAQPADGEEGVEDEQEHDARDLVGLVVARVDARQDSPCR